MIKHDYSKEVYYYIINNNIFDNINMYNKKDIVLLLIGLSVISSLFIINDYFKDLKDDEKLNWMITTCTSCNYYRQYFGDQQVMLLKETFKHVVKRYKQKMSDMANFTKEVERMERELPNI